MNTKKLGALALASGTIGAVTIPATAAVAGASTTPTDASVTTASDATTPTSDPGCVSHWPNGNCMSTNELLWISIIASWFSGGGQPKTASFTL